MKTVHTLFVLFIIAALVAACGPAELPTATQYVLTTDLRDGKFVYLGVSKSINGVINPALHAQPGERITILLVNSDEGTYDVTVPELYAKSDTVEKKGETTSLIITAPNQDSVLTYQDSHLADLGMTGVLLVGNVADPGAATSNASVKSVITPTGITVSYTLESALTDGKMVFIGKSGEIDSQVNPDLKANPGDKVQITLISGEGAEHDIVFDQIGARSEHVSGQGNSVSVEFMPESEGTFTYYCSIPGHRQAGMEGKFIVGSGVAPANGGGAASETTSSPMTMPVSAGAVDPAAVDIVRDPTDLPAPLARRGPQTIQVDLETVEVNGKLADGTTFKYWTFNGKVPGPFIRVRLGDTVVVRLNNAATSMMAHSVDFHAVTGPGGGAVATQTQPGGETTFTFQALNPGLFVYHCATPMVAQHIANGMYGLILVEPEGGLPPVDHEFYVMQGELYTAQPFGTTGQLTDDVTKLLNETPEYFVFNGAAGGLTSEAHMLHANVGETVRIYFGVGGPNFMSSFHVIGEIFDRVYNQASLTAAPLTDVQTTLVPPGGAVMVEFQLQVPGRYILVDHALSRLQRGLAGYLMVDGEANPTVFDGVAVPGSGH
jgi:nitrite reductase (NO-forming)